jgi:Flp pilus assembly protein TadG
MPAPELTRRRPRAARQRQAGDMLVEFGLIVLLFFAFMFTVIELARLMFLTNTLQEATRRAASGASVTDPTNTASMDQIRRNAIFRDSAGGLVLMRELTDRAVRIDYLSVSRDSSGNYAMQPASGGGPTSAADNRHHCAVDPYAGNCIRLVRVRICNPAITVSCEAMKFRPMTSLFNFQIPLPLATTIVKAQSFGAGPG